MKRHFVLMGVIFLSTLACSLGAKVTQSPEKTSTTTQAITSPAHISSPTVAPFTAQVTVAETTLSPTQVEKTKTPYPTSVLDSQLSQQVDKLQSQVQAERELNSTKNVPVVLLSPDELRQNVINDFMADETDQDTADLVMRLSILGLIKPDFDWRDFNINLLSEQIAGYYDDDIGEMFVVKGEAFGGPERMTYAHEFTHALQDQNYDIKNGLNYSNDSCQIDLERCAAIQALLEGDATLSEVLWFQSYASTKDREQFAEFYQSMKNPVFESSPAFYKDDLLFPYDQGFTFVQSFFDHGGWQAIDSVYHNPPVSTEQILHPAKYPSDAPIKVDLPDITTALGDGWRKVFSNQMGEWYTYLILARGDNADARVDDTTAQNAAAGWGGDEFLVAHNDSTKSTAFVMKTVWDTTDDAEEFASAFQQYANARFGVTASKQENTLSWSYDGGYSSFSHLGDTTIWIIAPDSPTAQTISATLQP